MKDTVCLLVAALLLSGAGLTSFKTPLQNAESAAVNPQNPVQQQEKKKRREAMQKDIALAINEIRLSKNLPELELKGDISRVAQIKAEEMLAEQYYVHKSPRHGMPDEMMRKFSLDFDLSGENIAWSGVFRSSVQEVVEGWLDIKADKENLLNPAFHRVGVGYAEDLGTRKYHWVVMFTD